MLAQALKKMKISNARKRLPRILHCQITHYIRNKFSLLSELHNILNPLLIQCSLLSPRPGKMISESSLVHSNKNKMQQSQVRHSKPFKYSIYILQNEHQTWMGISTLYEYEFRFNYVVCLWSYAKSYYWMRFQLSSSELIYKIGLQLSPLEWSHYGGSANNVGGPGAWIKPKINWFEDLERLLRLNIVFNFVEISRRCVLLRR